MNINQGKAGKSDNLAMNDGDAMGVGEIGGDDFGLSPLANAGERRKFNTGSLVLVGVIVLALGGLWFMRAISRVNAGTGTNRDLEATIENFIKAYKGGEKSGQGNSEVLVKDPNVLTALTDSYVDRQVPLNDVQRNPFILPGEDVEVHTGTDVNADSKAREKARKDKRTLFEKAAARLELKSVIMSDEPIANLSGKIVRRGADIAVDPEKVIFRVTEITADSITVVAEDEVLELVVPVTVILKRDH